MKLIYLLHKIRVRFFDPILYLGTYGKKTIICKVGNKAKFWLRVNTCDKIIIWEVWKTNAYIDSEFEIKKNDVVVDIGAHIGAFSVYAAKNTNNGNVYSYEPNKENYLMLLKNKSLNKLNNLFTFNQAISGKKGYINLYDGVLNITHSIYESTSKKKIKVKSNTLKDIFTMNNIRRVNYLKIDVEGAEYDILLNTPSNVFKKVDKIVLEYHDYLNHNYNYIDLKRHLENNGFKVKVCGNILARIIFGNGMIKARNRNS